LLVVSNTSPLTNLLAIDRLQLLSKLYDTVAVPSAVFQEITLNSDEVQPRRGLIEKDDFKSLPWLEIKRVGNRDLVNALLLELDPGESEAIALSVETKAELLLIDERKGRDVARQMGVNPIGLLGILIEAKGRNVIQNVKPVLERLKVDAGFWISEELFDRVLHEAGEEDQ